MRALGARDEIMRSMYDDWRQQHLVGMNGCEKDDGLEGITMLLRRIKGVIALGGMGIRAVVG